MRKENLPNNKTKIRHNSHKQQNDDETNLPNNKSKDNDIPKKQQDQKLDKPPK